MGPWRRPMGCPRASLGVGGIGKVNIYIMQTVFQYWKDQHVIPHSTL